MIRPSPTHAKFLSFHTPAFLWFENLYGHKSCCISSYSFDISPDRLPNIRLPWSSNTYILWYFRPPISQEQADRRSTWAPAFFVFRYVVDFHFGNTNHAWQYLGIMGDGSKEVLPVSHMSKAWRTPRFNGDRVQALYHCFRLPHGCARMYKV